MSLNVITHPLMCEEEKSANETRVEKVASNNRILSKRNAMIIFGSAFVISYAICCCMLAMTSPIMSSTPTFGSNMVRVEPTYAEKTFWEWLVINGADVSNIIWPAMNPQTGSRGVMAAKEIPANRDGNHVYVRIPTKLMITERKALDDPEFGAAILRYTTPEDPSARSKTELERIALYLIFQAGKPTAPFYAYTLILQEPSTLADWSAEEKREVHDDILVDECNHEQDEWRRNYRLLEQKNLPSGFITWDRYYWAVSNVYQRAFGIRDVNNQLLYNALVPGAELFNHANIGTHFKVTENGEEYVSYPVDRSIARGTECYLGYGRLSNAHLLNNYGFAMKGNPYEIVSLRYSPDAPSDRQLVMTFQDISAIGKGQYTHPGQAIRQFQQGVRTWKEAVRLCVDFLDAQLRESFLTTIEEDFLMLTKTSAPQYWRLRFALNYRIGKKLIIESYLNYCKAVQSDLSDDLTQRQFDLRVLAAARQVEERQPAHKASWFELDQHHQSRLAILDELHKQVSTEITLQSGEL